MVDFNVGDTGVALQFAPNIPIPSTATNLSFTFKGVNTGVRVVTTATSQNAGTYAQYVLNGTEFTVGNETYLWQFLYDNAGDSLSSVAPFPTLKVGSRL
jgi:hypothetical protein